MTVVSGQFSLTRSFPVTPDRLWALLTDPQARTAWGAPSDDMVLELDAHDLREGGRDIHRCGPKEAPEFTVETHWYHLEGPAKACFTESIHAGGARLSVSLVSYDLRPEGEGTTLHLLNSVTSLIGEDMTGDHEEGWTSALARLTTMIAAKDPALTA